MRSATLVVALAILLIGCGGPAPSVFPGATPPPSPSTTTGPAGAIAPTRICEAVQTADPPPFSCTEAIGKVLMALGPDAQFVQAAWFHRGAPCPPNARCAFPGPGSAYVVVRLDGARFGIVRLATEGGEVTVGAPEDPTFEIWPPSGQAIPLVGRPDAGPGAPAEVATRDQLPLCGQERNGVADRLARGCFFGAVLDGRPAELVRRSVDSAGEPVVVEILRFAGRGPVLVYRIPSVAGAGWTRNDCAIGSAFDDDQIFVVGECLVTEFS